MRIYQYLLISIMAASMLVVLTFGAYTLYNSPDPNMVYGIAYFSAIATCIVLMILFVIAIIYVACVFVWLTFYSHRMSLKQFFKGE